MSRTILRNFKRLVYQSIINQDIVFDFCIALLFGNYDVLVIVIRGVWGGGREYTAVDAYMCYNQAIHQLSERYSSSKFCM